MKLLLVFLNFFKKINENHSHETRLTEKPIYFLLRVTKSIGELLFFLLRYKVLEKYSL